MKEPLTSRFGGGLNLADAPDAIAQDQARLMENWRLAGQGWIASKLAAVELSAPDGDVVGIFPYDQTGSVGGVLLVWDSAGELVELWTVDGSGGNATNVGTLPGYASGVSSRPFFSAAQLAKCLFICDHAKTDGLVIYDPNDVLGSGSTMFQPTFDFDEDLTFEVALPRIIVEHANHLWMFGYGDEADVDRGEVARFSYLGLVDDSQGGGDAGSGGATGSRRPLRPSRMPCRSLLEAEDVLAARSANGRLVIATDRAASVIYGTGRDTWKRDEIDNQRGVVSEAGDGRSQRYRLLALPARAVPVPRWRARRGPLENRGSADDGDRLLERLRGAQGR